MTNDMLFYARAEKINELSLIVKDGVKDLKAGIKILEREYESAICKSAADEAEKLISDLNEYSLQLSFLSTFSETPSETIEESLKPYFSKELSKLEKLAIPRIKPQSNLQMGITSLIIGLPIYNWLTRLHIDRPIIVQNSEGFSIEYMSVDALANNHLEILRRNWNTQ